VGANTQKYTNLIHRSARPGRPFDDVVFVVDDVDVDTDTPCFLPWPRGAAGAMGPVASIEVMVIRYIYIYGMDGGDGESY